MSEQVDVPQVLAELRAERVRQGISQRELAQRIGTVQSAISELETGRCGVTLAMLGRIADVLECRIGVVREGPRRPPMSDRQIIRDESGEVAAAYCGEPLDETGRAAMLEVVAAARRRMEAEDPDGTLGQRQAEAIALIRDRARKAACCGDPKNLDGSAHPWQHVSEDGPGDVYRCPICGAVDVD